MDASGIGLITAFAAGVISFLSPCVLPIVPGYISYMAGAAVPAGGETESPGRLAALGMSALFVAGFSTVFVALGATASALGALLTRYRYETGIIGGIIIIVFGVMMLGAQRWMPWLYRDTRFNPKVLAGHPGSAYVLGLAFGFGWTPCIGPVLGAILTFSALGSANGMVLLGTYALGLGTPFLAAAPFLDRAARMMRDARRVGHIMQIGGGVVLILLGVAMVTGELSVFSYWLIDTFPALGKIG
jgi:cytochrome c-type biogenesis protein